MSDMGGIMALSLDHLAPCPVSQKEPGTEGRTACFTLYDL
jgi:hypothetical protein